MSKADMNYSLMYHINNNSLSDVKHVLKYNPDMHFENDQGMMPLHFSIKHQNIRIIKLLLERGANPLCASSKKSVGCPLGYAITHHEKPNPEFVKTLCEAVVNDEDFIHHKFFGRTIIESVISHRVLEVAKYLVKRLGVNTPVRAEGMPPLMYILTKHQRLDDAELDFVRFLINQGANVHAKFEYFYPLVQAIHCRDERVVSMLLEAGASPHQQSSGWSALMEACAVDFKEAVVMMLESCTDLSFLPGMVEAIRDVDNPVLVTIIKCFLPQMQQQQVRTEHTKKKKKKKRSTKSHTSQDEVNECKVCLDSTQTSALVPCGHFSFCQECAQKMVEIGTCPICRQEANMALVIYK